MLDKEVLKNDLYLLTKNFYKVIEVNLDEDTYFEVKVNVLIFTMVCGLG